MRFGWASGAMLGLMLLASCGRSGDRAAQAKASDSANAFFLSSNARQEGVQTLPSGLQYKVLQSGPPGGASPDLNDLVKVEYEGKLTDNTVFDSSFARGAPAIFTPETVIPGWAEALQRMHVGDEWMLWAPPELGYGEQGSPPTIPPNSVLIFRVRLLDVAQVPGGRRGGPVAVG